MKLISPDISNTDFEKFMTEALQEAELAGQSGELPIGAVIVVGDSIVSRGRAQHNEYKNKLRHAELNAMLGGGDSLWRDYQQAILFTTVEPCPLCLGATVMANIPHIIFAFHDNRMQSGHTIEANSYVKRHIKSYYGGVLEDRSIEIMAKYDLKALEYIQSGNK